jgi:hypothetical protein
VGIEVRSRDCAVLGDADFCDLADLVASTTGWEAGVLSKQAGEWVLATEALVNGRVQGFSFSSLERIGGTPALVIGMAAVARGEERAGVVRALMHANYHKALMAFPDEDVLVAARVTTPGPFDALTGLSDVRPWPGVRVNGEERAWGRRLSKRYGAAGFDDRTMVGRGEGEVLVFDHEPIASPPVDDVFGPVDPHAGDYVIAWGWALAEFLEAYEQPLS